MDVIGYILCAAAGAIIGAMITIRRWRKPEQSEDRMPPGLKQQYDNFWAYDGTERGQRDLED